MAQLLATLELLTWLHHTLSAVNSLAEGPFGVLSTSQPSAWWCLNLCLELKSAWSWETDYVRYPWCFIQIHTLVKQQVPTSLELLLSLELAPGIAMSSGPQTVDHYPCPHLLIHICLHNVQELLSWGRLWCRWVFTLHLWVMFSASPDNPAWIHWSWLGVMCEVVGWNNGDDGCGHVTVDLIL